MMKSQNNPRRSVMRCPLCKIPARFNGYHDTALGRKSKFFCRSCWKSFSGDYLDITPQRLGFLDIESSNLDADFGHVISWALKPEGRPALYDVIKVLSPAEEKRILKTLLKGFDRVDHVIGYYSSRFDVPFLRTKCLYYGLKFPAYGELFHTDLYFAVRGRLSLHRKRLGVVSEFLGTGSKQEVDGKIWAAAAFGDTASFKKILAHNIQDVVILENVWNRMTPHMKLIRRSI